MDKNAVARFNAETYIVGDTGSIPNNPFLPLIIYHNIPSLPEKDIASFFECRFMENFWPPAWRYTIYDFTHYHSNAHEVLGVFQGSATVRLGDSAGIKTILRIGDVLVIPAGVSHQRLESTSDFECVGAYPEGQKPDMNKALRVERPTANHRIKNVPLPIQDPIYGKEGLLMSLWKINS